MIAQFRTKTESVYTYIFPSSVGSFHNQIGKVPYDVALQAKNVKHIEDVEYHFCAVHGMIIAIAY